MFNRIWKRTSNGDRNAIFSDQDNYEDVDSQTASIQPVTQEHCHSLLLSQKEDGRAERSLVLVAVLSATFIVAEFTGGVLAHSLAILTDAGHMLSDLLSFIISIIAIRLARSPANYRLSFGYHRAEILGATMSIVIIWILTTMLIMLAVQRIIDNDLDVDANTMFVTACIGVLFNIIMGIVLHKQHPHPQEMDHNYIESRSANINVRAAFIHVIGDFVQSIGVLTAAIIIKLTDWKLADPICTFMFSLIVLVTSITVIRDIFFVLMEGTPAHIDYGALQNDLLNIDGVKTLHSLHVWSLKMDKTALAVHLAIEEPNRAIETMKTASKLIRYKHGIYLATVQVELYETFMLSCRFCKPLFQVNAELIV